MAGNVKNSQVTQSLCSANESNDYSDPNNGLLYNLVPSKKLDSCTVTFFHQQTYNEITKLLRAEYNFKPNVNGSAFLANAEIGSSTVVLTLYKTKKLLIQGGGTWEWRNSVFRSLSNKLTACNLLSNQNSSARNTPLRRKSVPRQVDNAPTSLSPINIFNKVMSKIKSPRSTSTPVNTTSAEVGNTLHKVTKLDSLRKSNSEDLSLISNSLQDDSVVDIDSDDEITYVKNLYTSNREASQIQQNETSEEIRQLSSIKTELDNQKKENRALQESSRDLLRQTQKLKQEHEKLLRTVEAKNIEVTKCKKRIQSDSIALQNKDKTIKDLENKLASASADTLIFQEQNKKLKEDIKALKVEKTSLVDKFMSSTGATDSIESKLESEIDSLKNELMLEIQQIKQQIKKSTELQTALQNEASAAREENQTRPPNSVQNRQSTEKPPNVLATQSCAKSVFIAGDNATSILSPRIMSDSDMTVKIKTHKEACIKTIEGSLVKLADNNSDYFKNLKAVVLHVGAQNISDADTSETMVNELKDAADTIRNVNPEVKILISSILPRRNDRLINNAISEANHSIKDVCQEQNYVYIDHDQKFFNNGKPDVTLYKDGVNLNRKGGKFLGQNIKETLSSTLHSRPRIERESGQNASKQTANKDGFRYQPHTQQQGFRYRTRTQHEGFRQRPQIQQERVPSRMIPPWMAFYPPWMPAAAHPQNWK